MGRRNKLRRREAKKSLRAERYGVLQNPLRRTCHGMVPKDVERVGVGDSLGHNTGRASTVACKHLVAQTYVTSHAVIQMADSILVPWKELGMVENGLLAAFVPQERRRAARTRRSGLVSRIGDRIAACFSL